MRQVKLCDLREVKRCLNKNKICYEDIVTCASAYGKSSCIRGGLCDEDGWILDCKIGEWTDNFDWYRNFSNNRTRFYSDEPLPDTDYLVLDVYDYWIDFSESIID